MRVLFSYITGLGNGILLLPTLYALREARPRAGIWVLVRSHSIAEMFHLSQVVTEAVVVNESDVKRPLRLARLLAHLRQQRFDRHLIPIPSRRWPFHVLAALAGGRRRIGLKYRTDHYRSLAGLLLTHTVPVDETRHDVEQNLALLPALGVQPPRRPCFDLPPDPEGQAGARRFLAEHAVGGPYLMMHPGCKTGQGNDLKRWPTERFARVAIALQRHHPELSIIWVLGPSETGLQAELRHHLNQPPLVYPGGPLARLAALLASARLLCCNDSGVMHLAAAVGTPTVSIFGPSVHSRTRPWGDHHRTIRLGLPCQPCLAYPFENAGGAFIRCHLPAERRGACLAELQVQPVLEAVEGVLGRPHLQAGRP